MRRKLASIMCAMPGIALTIGVKTVFSPCVHADGSVSACAGSGQWIFIAALAMVVLALIRAFLPRVFRSIADGVLVLIGVFTMLIPKFAGTCMMNSMRCNRMLKPFAIAMAVIGILVFAVCLKRDLKMSKEKK